MNIHEYQGKELLAKFGVSVPKGGVASTPEEAAEIAKELIDSSGLSVHSVTFFEEAAAKVQDLLN